MAPRKESDRYRQVLDVFTQQEKPITVKDAIAIVEGKAMSVRTMQEYVSLMIKESDLNKYVEVEGQFVDADAGSSFQTPYYAVPGLLESSSQEYLSVVVQAYMYKLRKVLRGDADSFGEIGKVVDMVKESAPGWIARAKAFREDNPFVSGFVAGSVVAALMVMFIAL